MEENLGKNSSLKKEFESLLAEDLSGRNFKEGEIVVGTVEEIGKNFVYLDLGLKSSSAVPIEEFKLSNEIDEIKIGSKVKILLERLEHPKTGSLITSREKARKAVSWQKMEKAFENSEKIKAKIVSRIKGGYAVDCQSCLCFLPNSQISIKPLSSDEIRALMKEPQVFEIVKMDKRRGNIVVSRRQHLQKTVDATHEEEISKLEVGMIIEDAIVKALTPWGAFITVNNMETLCHINEISHSRISAPSDLLKVSQKLRVKIIKIDNETKKSIYFN
jgi:small subunit ribosomal protein S1